MEIQSSTIVKQEVKQEMKPQMTAPQPQSGDQIFSLLGQPLSNVQVASFGNLDKASAPGVHQLVIPNWPHHITGSVSSVLLVPSEVPAGAVMVALPLQPQSHAGEPQVVKAEPSPSLVFDVKPDVSLLMHNSPVNAAQSHSEWDVASVLCQTAGSVGVANETKESLSSLSHLASVQLPDGCKVSEVKVKAQVLKEWQQDISPDVRNYLVHKLMQTMFPTQSPETRLDVKMPSVFAYARSLEDDMFEVADSRFEYFYTMAETIVTIQKELDRMLKE